MADDRADGPTFALENICFIDFETRSQTDIKAGTYRYACEADAIVLVWAIGDGPVHAVAVADFSRPLEEWDLPRDILEHVRRVKRGEAVFAAWNAGFDRAIWNYATIRLSRDEAAPHHRRHGAGDAPPDCLRTSTIAPNFPAPPTRSPPENR